MAHVEIRVYKPTDYPELRRLYEAAGWFDESVDSEEMINDQVKKDPSSVLVAVSNGEIVGTVTLLATGRLALFFRLISKEDEKDIRRQLLEKGESLFVKKGYKRIDIIAPEQDHAKHQEYIKNGFVKGNSYRWFWKETS